MNQTLKKLIWKGRDDIFGKEGMTFLEIIRIEKNERNERPGWTLIGFGQNLKSCSKHAPKGKNTKLPDSASPK